MPTVAGSGFPGFEAGVWMAVVAPAKTPTDALKRLNEELVRIIRDPALKASLWDRVLANTLSRLAHFTTSEELIAAWKR